MTMMQLWKHLYLLSLQVGPLTYFVYLQFELYNNVIIQSYSLLISAAWQLEVCQIYNPTSKCHHPGRTDGRHKLCALEVLFTEAYMRHLQLRDVEGHDIVIIGVGGTKHENREEERW